MILMFFETIFVKATRVKMVLKTKTSFCLDLHVVKSIVHYLVTLCDLSACSILARLACFATNCGDIAQVGKIKIYLWRLLPGEEAESIEWYYRTKLSRRGMIWLLPHPSRQQVVSLIQSSLVGGRAY